MLAKVELVWRQRPVRGGAHGARCLGRLTARRIVLADGLVPALERGLAQVVEPDDALRVQIIGDRNQALVEQRQPVLHAWIGTASGYRFEQRIAGCRAELLKVADPEPLDRGVVEQHLADRPQADLRDIAERALGQRVEGADTLELVAEQVEPERAFAAAREDVDDAAAYGILARLHHRAAAPIAVARETGEQLSAVDALAGARREQAGAQRLRRRHLLHQGIDRGDDQTRSARLEQPGQRVEPARHDVGIRRNPIVGQAVPGRQHRDLEIRREEADQLGEVIRAHAIARHVQDLRCGRIGRHPGEVQGVQAFDG